MKKRYMYLARAILNNQGEIIDYEVKYKISEPIKPRGGGYEILYGEVVAEFPKAVLQDGIWQVVENVVKKQQKEDKKNEKESSKNDLDNTDMKKIKNLDDVIKYLEKLHKHFFN